MLTLLFEIDRIMCNNVKFESCKSFLVLFLYIQICYFLDGCIPGFMNTIKTYSHLMHS